MLIGREAQHSTVYCVFSDFGKSHSVRLRIPRLPSLTTLLTRFCAVQKQSMMTSKNRSNPLYSEVQMLGTLLIIILILGLVGAFPRWGYSRDWGYWPSGGLGLVLLVVLVLVLMGRI